MPLPLISTDAERKHGFEAAVAEYDRLRQVYPNLGYEVTILPRVTFLSVPISYWINCSEHLPSRGTIHSWKCFSAE